MTVGPVDEAAEQSSIVLRKHDDSINALSEISVQGGFEEFDALSHDLGIEGPFFPLGANDEPEVVGVGEVSV